MTGRMISISAQRARYVAVDWITSTVAFLLFNIYRFYFTKETGDLAGFLLSRKLVSEQLLIPTAMLCIYWLSGYYNQPFNKSRLQELVTTFFSAVLNTAGIFLLMLINDVRGKRTDDYEMLLILLLLLFVMTYAGRLTITFLTRRRFKKRKMSFKTLMVGNSEGAHRTAEELGTPKGARYGYRVVGFVSIPGEREAAGEKAHSLQEIGDLCQQLNIDQIIISPEKYDDQRVLELLYDLYDLHIPVKISPDTLSFVTSGIHLEDIYGDPLVDLTSPRISDSAKNLKRTADVLVSAAALLILSPVYAAVAAAVRLTSKGPVIYRQRRIGIHHKPFTIYKFRTMRTDAEAAGPQLSGENDPRVTKVGRVMRKYRIDELPQFWNVLKGDMSLVGPRPEREYFIRQIVKEAPYYTLVHQVRPGITSWGMVKYGYASTVAQMVERTRFDLIYLSNMSTMVDIKILIHTLKTVMTGKGK